MCVHARHRCCCAAATGGNMNRTSQNHAASRKRTVTKSLTTVGALLCGLLPAAFAGCAQEDLEDPGQIEEAVSSPSGAPTCTFPQTAECLDGCQGIDDLEASYRRNPTNGRLASYDSTGVSTV